MNKIFLYTLYFFFYSAGGWAFESTYCSIGERKLINRGFLTGPMCPIYGTGTLVMEVLLYPLKANPIIVFLLGMVFCDIVEYLTSFIMEKLFNARWWNYKDEFLNLHGRICLKHSIIWGMASLAFVKLLHPKVERLFERFSDEMIRNAVLIILVIFLIDLIAAVIKATGMRKLMSKFRELKETISSGASGALNAVDEKYNSLKLIAEGKYDKFIVTVSGKYHDIGNTIDKGNDIINDKRDEVILQTVLIIRKVKEKIQWNHEKDISGNLGKGPEFRNIKLNVRKLSDEIKNIIDDMKNGVN